MKKKEIILAVLASAEGAIHTPIQIQKILFLIDKNIPNLIKGPYFNFEPYSYGPFDVEIYNLLEELAREEYIEVISDPSVKWSKYRLSINGQKNGNKILITLNKNAVNYIKKLSSFVRGLSFAELISTIYKAYPDMKKNSIFGS